MIVDPWGTVLAEADDREMIISSDIDLDKVQESQRAIPVLRMIEILTIFLKISFE